MKKISCILFCFIFYSSAFSQAVNFDFESTSPGTYSSSNSVSGWTLSNQTASCTNTGSWSPGSSEFSVITTPIISFPIIGNILNSPLGGSNVVRLNNSTANSSRTKLAQTFSVNSSNTLLQYAFADVMEASNSHLCCEQTGFSVLLKDASGNILSCSSLTFIASGSVCINPSTSPNYSFSSSSAWSNWQVKYLDLTPYVNSIITIEVISTDCYNGDHFGTLFFDAKLGGQLVGSGLSYYTNYPNTTGVSYCVGSGVAQIQAPIGYVAYQWMASGTGNIAAPQGTMSTLTVTNPIANSIYTLVMQTSGGCIFATVYAITSSTVSISAVGTSSTCQGGASGSATISPTGSGAGYTYNWINSSNVIVGISSIVSSLAPGNYTVTVSAAGSASSSCGIATTTVNIGVSTPGLISLIKPFCTNEAYLSVNGGSNFQWYNGMAAITASAGGTQSSYTVNTPTNGSIYRLTYLSSQGCVDSLEYTLLATSPGSLVVSSNSIICAGANNGVVVLSMYPAAGAQVGQNTFSVFSIGTTSPAYSASITASAINSFTATNLSAGGTYSVKAFDGSCKYSTSFSVTPFVFNYTLFPSNSPTLCPGNSIAAGPTFSSPPSLTQYSYSWSPTTFLVGGMGSYQNTIITPSAYPGSSFTMVYTVVITPSIINCPLTKTLAISFANPQSPTISAIPAICANGSIYSVTINPGGGIIMPGSSPAISSTGILSPSLASIGVNSFTYASSIGTCVAKSSSTFTVNAPPQISISGNTVICEGQSSTLLANGPASFTWNNFGSGPLLTISPSITTVYTVTGLNTVNSCSNSAMVTVMVSSPPTISITGDTLICLGESVELQAQGANLVNWSNGFNTQQIIFNPQTTATYTVTGTNGTCTNSAVVEVIVLECNNVQKLNNEMEGLKIFPNPANEKLCMETLSSIHFILYDNLGKLILQSSLESGLHCFNLNNYHSGVYTLKIMRANDFSIQKVIISN